MNLDIIGQIDSKLGASISKYYHTPDILYLGGEEYIELLKLIYYYGTAVSIYTPFMSEYRGMEIIKVNKKNYIEFGYKI